MKASEALQAVRDLIECGERHHLCPALEMLPQGRAGARRALARIYHLLYPHSTLSQWLAARGIVVQANLVDVDRLRQTRLNWIDNMIEWHRAKGD